jgi:hypothetical protein
VGGSIVLNSVRHVSFEVDYEEKHLMVYEVHADQTTDNENLITLLLVQAVGYG